MFFSRLSPACFLLLSLTTVTPLGARSSDTEFFEKKIRPLLIERCHACHGGETSSPMGGLKLDSAEAMLKGGTRGPAITPGKPEQSLLITAISYRDPDLKMPPTGPLSVQQIQDFIDWVKMGAPHPRNLSTAIRQENAPDMDRTSGHQFWSFRPVKNPPLPRVRDRSWVSSPIDFFVLSKLEQKDLKPASPADKRSWIRRVTFGLTGLPPTPSEVEHFIYDPSPNSQENVVNRLLSSPHYGERWGRHWLDLVSFAETNGHEFDSPKPDVWRYRDYVIRALNDDVPYDRFIKEHIAGDLLAEKRLGPRATHWESPVSTSFFWLGERLNGALDSVKARADEVDNQIDILSKTFLGLTVACARCHDHKFDPIPTADYYSLAGILHSTDFAQTIIDSPDQQRKIAALSQQITDQTDKVAPLLRPAQTAMAEQLGSTLLAAAELASPRNSSDPSSVGRRADQLGLEAELLQAWVETLRQACGDSSHLFYPLATLIDRLASRLFHSFAQGMETVRSELTQRSMPVRSDDAGPGRIDIVFEDFENPDYVGWRVRGQAFGTKPEQRIPSNQALRAYQGQTLANSFGGGSEKLVGSLTSRKFTMPELPRDYREHGTYLHVRLAGSKQEPLDTDNSQVSLNLIADGVKSSSFLPQGSWLQWKSTRLTIQVGRICYFEILDRRADGHIVVDKIVFSNSKQPPTHLDAPNRHLLPTILSDDITSMEFLSQVYQELFLQALNSDTPSNRNTRWILASLSPTGRMEDLSSLLPDEDRKALTMMGSERRDLEARIPPSRFAMSSEDRSPRNIRIHLRGDHKNLGREVPRRFLQVLAGKDQPGVVEGSGRLQLADQIAHPQNPLTARVMVNRVWKHHFGEGIVRSVDNFGKTGDQPSHPELLDFLAHRFMSEGWSLKALQRMIVLSSTYWMSSRRDRRASSIDPQNRLLHHVPVKRLEAEAIRDSILTVAGSLKRQLFGPSVPPHISKYQDGRGKPKSGPLDGNGRRSLYVQVRRNFLTPLFLAFDYPPPISTIGRRGVSTVPSQALMMLNNAFIAGEARAWARRLIDEEADLGRRAQRMVLEAYGREPAPWEVDQLLQFAASGTERYRQESERAEPVEQQVWADLGHALMNSAEFIYLR